MSYYIFEYFINNKKKFAGTLLREQCAGHDEINGRKKRCKNYVSIGLPYCHRERYQDKKKMSYYRVWCVRCLDYCPDTVTILGLK
jgi:hypothetical protein